jgi:tetrahydromethanopterin S-methyltransferase subunit G
MEALPDRVDRIEQKLDSLSASVDTRFDEVRDAIVEQRQYTEFAFGRLESVMVAEFRKVHDRLDRTAAVLDEKIDRSTAELNAKLDRSTAELNAKLDQTNAQLNAKLDRVLQQQRRGDRPRTRKKG